MSTPVTVKAQAAWPFPSPRKRAEMAQLEAELNSRLAPITKGAIDAEIAATSDSSPSNEAGKTDNRACKSVQKRLAVQRAEPEPHTSRARVPATACNVNILALDLGTKCGWAYSKRDGKVRSGTENFSAGKNPHPGYRWLLMRTWLGDVSREMGEVHVVYYEEVKRHVSNLSARAYCGFLAILEVWCATNNVRLVGVGVGTIKKHATGNGRASKEDMIDDAKRRGVSVVDDNEGDAIGILGYAVKQEAA